MEDQAVLQAILDNAQIPHQPFLVIQETPTFPAKPLFVETLRRAVARGGDVVLISVLGASDSLLSPTLPISKVKVLDLTDCVPGFSSDQTWSDLQRQITALYKDGSPEIFIDALDVLAEDYGLQNIVRLVRNLLTQVRSAKAPSRLTLLLPHTSALLSHLTPSTFTPTLTLLHPSNPALLEHLSALYLTPVGAEPKYWQILQKAHDRRLPDYLAYAADAGLEVTGWPSGSVKAAAVQILVRKAAGGAKGLVRAMAGMTTSDRQQGSAAQLIAVPIDEVVRVNPFAAPLSGSVGIDTKETTHADLNLPFNLNLTDAQRRQRQGVPLPYAHEGEGADLGWEEEEDDDDDEEV